ncbi:hypothetical protein LTR65_007334 [Meristemomyces frigidus]
MTAQGSTVSSGDLQPDASSAPASQQDSQAGTAATVLTSGGSAAVVSDHTISQSVIEVLADGDSSTIAQISSASDPETGAIVSLGGVPVTASQLTGSSGVVVVVVVAQHTLSIGGSAAIISGQTVSAASSGLVVGSTTAPLAALPASGSSSASEAVVALGGNTITASAVSGASGVVVIAGQTLSAGGPEITVSGQAVTEASDGLVVGGTTIAFSSIPAVADPALWSGAVLALGGTTVTASELSGQSGVVVIGDKTLSAGGPAVTTDGHVKQQPTEAVLTINNTPVTAVSLSNGDVLIGSYTLSAGGPAIETDGQVVSYGLGGVVVDGTSTVSFSDAPSASAGASQTEAVFTIGGSSITAAELANGAAVIGSKTLSIGGPAVTIGSHVVSEGSTGIVVDGTSTIGFSEASDPSAGASATEAVFTINNNPITATELANGEAVIGSRTLSVGGPAVTIGSHVISEGSSGIVVDGTSLATFSLTVLSAGPSETAAVFAIDGTLVTATELSNGDAVIQGQTLSVGGPAVTIDGEIVSQISSGLLVAGTSTVGFSTTQASPGGSGSASESGISGASAPTRAAAGATSASSATQSGGAGRLVVGRDRWFAGLLGAILLLSLVGL